MMKKFEYSQPTAAVLIIGDEILSGRTCDSNSNYIAKKLSSVGIKLAEIRTICDDKKVIIKNINKLRKKYNYIFTSGGIGPTHDDITAESVAMALNIRLDINKKAKKILEDYYLKKNQTFNDARMKMARIPVGSKLIRNDVSSAPGFNIKNIFVLAGVPEIFENMVDNLIKELKTGPITLSQTIVINKPEGDIVESLDKIVNRYQNISLGSYPFFKNKKIGTNIVVRHHDKIILKKVCLELEKLR